MYIIPGSPTRVQVTPAAKELAEKLDAEGYFGLGQGYGRANSISRSQLFAFAMALGFEINEGTPLDKQYQGGFIQDTAFDGRLMALICGEWLCSIGEDNLDQMTNKSAIYKLAEQYANTGFNIIAKQMAEQSEEELLFDMLMELDDMYEQSGLMNTLQE